MQCGCGANYADGHGPGCEIVARLVREIQSGKSKIVFGPSGSDFVTVTVKSDAEPTWESIHGLNERGETPNHQPECKEHR